MPQIDYLVDRQSHGGLAYLLDCTITGTRLFAVLSYWQPRQRGVMELTGEKGEAIAIKIPEQIWKQPTEDVLYQLTCEIVPNEYKAKSETESGLFLQ